ncbi:hypothetical protein CANDROIZ_430004 [Candidatus Roizmanbacteria bacterium]|nr:hypothetical protein CANDROIZ_430004 [Candidatus Roizmanbacteria bacterium]
MISRRRENFSFEKNLATRKKITKLIIADQVQYVQMLFNIPIWIYIKYIEKIAPVKDWRMSQ